MGRHSIFQRIYTVRLSWFNILSNNPDGTIDGVDWVVINDALGDVISSYPTGGQPIQF